MGGKIPHDFTVWIAERDGRWQEKVAACSRQDIGMGAYTAACAAYPDKHVSHRHGMRVIAERAPLPGRTRLPAPVRAALALGGELRGSHAGTTRTGE